MIVLGDLLTRVGLGGDGLVGDCACMGAYPVLWGDGRWYYLWRGREVGRKCCVCGAESRCCGRGLVRALGGQLGRMAWLGCRCPVFVCRDVLGIDVLGPICGGLFIRACVVD